MLYINEISGIKCISTEIILLCLLLIHSVETFPNSFSSTGIVLVAPQCNEQTASYNNTRRYTREHTETDFIRTRAIEQFQIG